jgi:hypothetical protein
LFIIGTFRNAFNSTIESNFSFGQFGSSKTLLSKGTDVLDVNFGFDLKHTVITFVLTFCHSGVFTKEVENDLVEFGKVVFQFLFRRVGGCTAGIATRLGSKI